MERRMSAFSREAEEFPLRSNRINSLVFTDIFSCSSISGSIIGVLEMYFAELFADGLIAFKHAQNGMELQYASMNSRLTLPFGKIPTMDWSNNESSISAAVGFVDVTIGKPTPFLK